MEVKVEVWGGRCNFQVNPLRGRGAWEREIARSGTE